jgi:hypothetical protein
MGRRMRFSCGECRFEVDVDSEVVLAMEEAGSVAELAGGRPWPEGSEAPFDYVASAERLREAFATIRRRVKATKREPDYIYLARARVMPGSDLEDDGSGAIYGFRIGGEIRGLDLGLNQCVLSHMRVRPDGTGEIVSQEDVRHLKYIETDDIGRITIRKRKAAGPVDKWIRKVLKKLQDMEGDVVVEMA